MPRTDAIFGRPSARASHWLYYTQLAQSAGKATIAFRDPTPGVQRATLVEVRVGGASGAQTVFPGSTHETGELISWETNGEPAQVEDDDLLQRVRLTAAGCLFARYWPSEGARHEAALAIGGFLARAGVKSAQIQCLAEGVAKAAADPEVKDRIRAACDSACACHEGKSAFGFPKLREVFGEAVASTVAEWLNYRTGQHDFPAAVSVNDSQPLGWNEPVALPKGLKPVAQFDYDFLPGAIGPWVEDISDRMQCPPDFVAIPAITALGSSIGSKFGIRPQRQTNWLEVPNFWGCIVGRPGAMKSPAMAEALKPLNRLEMQAREEHEEAMKEYEAEKEEYELRKEAAQKKAKVALQKGEDLANYLNIERPEKPKAKRLIVNDCTYEALGEILADNENGVLALRDELMSLLKTLDREEYVAARGFFLSAWNGTSSYTFDRIIRGRTYVKKACVSLLGSTQPGKIAEYMRRARTGGLNDDGLIQRFGLLVWPDQSPEWNEVDRYPDSLRRQSAWDVFRRLTELTPDTIGAERDQFEEIPFVRFDENAQGYFAEWRPDLEKRLRSGGLHPALESHLAKYRKLVPALALINHLADGGFGPITSEAVLRAIAFSQYLETHAVRAYAAGSEAETLSAGAILTHIRKGDLKDGFTARDVGQNDWSRLTDRDQIDAGLRLLSDYEWIASTKIQTGGRPKEIYRINPRAFQ